VRRLALARAISFCGSTSAYVALAAYVYARTGSPTWVAAVALASFATPALVSPLAGAVGDRRDRRDVMVASDLLGAACFIAMALTPAPAALVALKALASVVAAPAPPAQDGVVPLLAPRGSLAEANSTVAVAGTAGLLVGPLLGGAVVAASGAPLVFALNAATFLASALLLTGLPRRPAGEPRARRDPGRLHAGFAALWRDRVLRRATACFAVAYLGVGLTFPAELVLVADLGAGPAGYGVLVAGWGAGGISGAWLARHALRRRGPRPLLAAAAAGIAAGFLAAAVAPVFALAVGGFAVAGLCEGVAEVARRLLVQVRAEARVRSRALAAEEAVDQAGLAVAILLGAPLVTAVGAAAAFAVAAGLCATGALLAAGWPAPAASAAGHPTALTWSR
jgi:MFS family permease